MKQLSVVFALLVCLIPAVVSAQTAPTASPRQEAVLHSNRGNSAFTQGQTLSAAPHPDLAAAHDRYLEAAHEFDTAHDQIQDPAYRYNAAEAYARANELTLARDRYQSFLQEQRPTGAQRAEIETAIRLLDTVIATAHPTATPPQNGAQTIGHAATATATPPVGPTNPPRTRVEYVRRFPVGPVILGGLGVLSLDLCAWSIGVSVDADSRVGNYPATDIEHARYSGRADNARNGAIGFGIGAGVLIGSAVVWYLLRGPGERREIPPVAFAPLASGGAVASFQGTF